MTVNTAVSYVSSYYEKKYTDSFLVTSLYFAVSQVRGVAPRINLYHLVPSLERSFKIIRHLEQVFEPYRKMCRECKEKKRRTRCFCREKTPKNT